VPITFALFVGGGLRYHNTELFHAFFSGRQPFFCRGSNVRDIRARWALNEAGQDYDVDLVDMNYVKGQAHRHVQPFGQIPTYRDEKIEIFESGAIVLHVCETNGVLVPTDQAARIRAVQWTTRSHGCVG